MAQITMDMDHFGIDKWSKMTLLRLAWEPSGSDLGPFWNHFEAFSSMFEPVNSANYNGKGPFWDHLGSEPFQPLSPLSTCALSLGQALRSYQQLGPITNPG